MENFEELKRSILVNLNNREEMPIDIIKIVGKSLETLNEIYDDMKCNNSTIKTYLEGKFNEINEELKSIGEERRNEHQEQVIYLLNKIKIGIEELGEDIQQKSQEEKDKEEFFYVKSKNIETTEKIVDIIKQGIISVQSTQKRILDYNGFSGDRIEQIEQSVLKFVLHMQSRSSDEISEILEKDDKKLQNELVQQYEDYLEYSKKDEKSKYRQSLDANISLEEQKEYALKMQESEQKDLNEGDISLDLPGNVIE